MQAHSEPRDEVERLADDFIARHRRGERPQIEAYAAAHPQLADQIRQLFPTVLALEALRNDKANGAPPNAPAGVSPPGALLGVQQLGDFRLIREIGRGGMGIVYEAEQASLFRRVAVKILPSAALRHPKHLARFRREAQTAARLHHANIVPVFGTGEQDGCHYLVMQFIDGVGLDELIAELRAGADGLESALRRALQRRETRAFEDTSASIEKPGACGPAATDCLGATVFRAAPFDPAATSDLAPPAAAPAPESEPPPRSIESRGSVPPFSRSYWIDVVRLGIEIASALDYAHTLGTLHRDIKPSNLLYDVDGVIWVADFGLAKAVEHDDLTLTGDVVGTLAYMPPEQLAGTTDSRSDVYSVGLTLYELLTLRPAYGGASRADLIRQITSGSVPRPQSINPGVPRDLETIVLKAMAREPHQRYATARELHDDLRAFVEDRPIRARRATAWERAARWCRRNPTVAGLSGLAAGLLMLAGGAATAGYLQTSAALSRELEQRTRAENRLAISLEALDRVYRRFAPDRISDRYGMELTAADGEASVEIVASPVISQATAAMLEELLPLYDRLAADDGGNRQLQEEAARASRRVGDIHFRLGRWDSAETAYRAAIAKYARLAAETGELAAVTEVARIHNELGRIYRRLRDRQRSEAEHHAALELLAEVGNEALPAARFELARTHYLIANGPDRLAATSLGLEQEPPAGPFRGRGDPRGRPNREGFRGPERNGPFREGIDAAPEEGRPREGERGGDGRPFPGPPSFAPARGPGRDGPWRDGPPGPSRDEERRPNPDAERRPGEREPPRDAGRPLDPGRPGRSFGPPPEGPVDPERLQLAIVLLTKLVDEFPENPDYRFLLALCRRDATPAGRAGEDSQARSLLEALCREFPGVADYRFELAQTLSRIDLRAAPRDFGAIETRLRQAQQLALELVQQQRDVADYTLCLVQVQQRLAHLLMRGRGGAERFERGRIEEAERLFRDSVERMAGLVERWPQEPVYRLNLARQRETFARLLRDRANPAAARTVLELSIADLERLTAMLPQREETPLEAAARLMHVLPPGDDMPRLVAQILEEQRFLLRSLPEPDDVDRPAQPGSSPLNRSNGLPSSR